MPVASDPAGMLMVALPFVSAEAGAELYVPLVRITEPVGVALAPPPATVTVTESACRVVTLADEGVAVTVGVIFAGTVTATIAVPLLPKSDVSLAAGVKVAVKVSVPAASDPAGMTVETEPAAHGGAVAAHKVKLPEL